MDITIATNILYISLTLCVILITVGLGILIYYIISLLKSAHYFLGIVIKQSEKFTNDIEKIRGFAQSTETIIISFIAFIFSIFKRYRKSKK